MLVTEVPVRKGRLGSRQLVELARDLHPLGGRAARELALPLEPGDQGQRAVRRILPRLVEPPYPAGEDRLQRIDAAFPDLDQAFAQCRAIGFYHPRGHIPHPPPPPPP